MADLMNILIADKMSDQAISELKARGGAITYEPDLSTDDLPGPAPHAEILIVRSTQVTREIIDAMPELSLIIRAGAGVNTIDVTYAGEKGVYVANCPGKNTAAVAELALGLLIAADRRIADATVQMRAGQWQKKEFGKAAGLKGRTLGVIGCGQIGRAVITRARAMELRIIGWSRSLTAAGAAALGIDYAPDLATLARQADLVTVHVASSADTRGMIDDTFFAAMKDNAVFVNTSRGDIVQSAALSKAIQEKGIKAALDVYEEEPSGGTAEFPATDLAARITATPHIGASTEQAAEAISAETVRIVKTFMTTGVPANPVNLCEKSTASYNLVVRHQNKVGVLAGVLDELKADGVNVEEVHNTVFQGNQAACCTIYLDSCPSDSCLATIKNGAAILQAMLNRIE